MPARRLRREDGDEVVLQILARIGELAEEGGVFGLVEIGAEDQMAELHRHEGDDREGQRVAEEGAEEAPPEGKSRRRLVVSFVLIVSILVGGYFVVQYLIFR